MTETTTLSAGEALKVARRRKGWTQERCAEELGVHRITLTNWETGRNAPAPVNLGVISEVLGIDPAVFSEPISRAQAVNFGQRIRQARTNAGLSVEKLAYDINRAPRTIEAWERGERPPNEKNIRILERWLETPLDIRESKPTPRRIVRLANYADEVWHQLEPHHQRLFASKDEEECKSLDRYIKGMLGVLHKAAIDRAKASGQFPQANTM